MRKKIKVELPKNKVKIFKVRNRAGYAAVYMNNLTEGKTRNQAYSRMVKAVNRKS